jgi:hypothetical protein
MTSALGAAFAASLCAATPAQALEPRQCLPMAEMNEALRAEGQRTMIIGDRQALQNPTGRVADASIDRYVNTVTSNADGSLGYQLEGDLPRAQVSTRVCVAAKLTNVRMYDARRDAIPQAAYLGGQFDAVVRENAAKGTRPMLIADTVHPASGGTERRGLPLVMFGNIPGRSASIVTRMPDGQPQFLVLMGDTEYTAAGLARLNTQVAMVVPK